MIKPTTRDDYTAKLIDPAWRAAADIVFEVHTVSPQLERMLLPLLAKSTDRKAVVSPVLWQPKGRSRDWYFILTLSLGKGANITRIAGQGADHCDELRHQAIMTMFNQRPPFTVYDAASELETAEANRALWPNKKTRKVYDQVLAESRAAQA